jgi:hypothetical protein
MTQHIAQRIEVQEQTLPPFARKRLVGYVWLSLTCPTWSVSVCSENELINIVIAKHCCTVLRE